MTDDRLSRYVDAVTAPSGACPDCWRDEAAQADYDKYPEGGGKHLCWEGDCRWNEAKGERPARIAQAVMAVADEEQAVLRDTLTARTEALHRTAAENDRLRDTLARVEAKVPDECWTFRAKTTHCSDFVGSTLGGGPGTFTPDMVCLPCQFRVALVQP